MDLVCVWTNTDPVMTGNNATGTCDGEGRVDPDDDPANPDAPEDPRKDDVDVVEKIWDSSRLDCTPEQDTNPTGSTHTVTCAAKDSNDQSRPGTVVDVEATGANDPDSSNSLGSPDFTCTTGIDGTCTFNHGPATNNVGITTYRAWIDIDNSNSTTEADAAEARDEGATAGDEPEPDDTDVVEKTWGASRLDCTPEQDVNPTGTTHTVTCTAKTSNDSNVEGAHVDVEATGANDPDSGNTPESPDFTCVTNNGGQCTFDHGPNTNDVGTTTYRAWIDLDDSNTTTEADATEGRDEGATPGADAEPDDTDVVEKTWGASRLDCTPEQASSQTGTTHTVTCTARTSNDATVQGVQVDAEGTGTNDPDAGNTPNSPDLTCTTGVDGTCSFQHGPGIDTGTTTYRAWIDFDNDNSTTEADATEGRDESATPGADAEQDDTDVVENTWVPNPARTISLNVNKEDVFPGTKVKFSGSIDGHPACEAGQTVRLRAARPGKKFYTVATVATNPNGSYQFTLVVTKTKDYRTVTPVTATCDRAKSNKVRVRVL